METLGSLLEHGRFHALRVLDVNNSNNVVDDGVAALADGLQQATNTTSLTKLHLRGCGMSDAGLTRVASRIAHGTLEELRYWSPTMADPFVPTKKEGCQKIGGG